MKIKLTKTDDQEIFEAILELDPVDSIQEHRRGSTFFTEYIYTITEEDLEYVPELKDYVGTSWKTENFIQSEEDSQLCYVDELYRVEQEEKVVTIKEWVDVV